MTPPRTAPESRTIDVDVTEVDTRGRTVTGYAAVYDRESRDLGGFRERIAPGAFAAVLADGADVRCLLNHDANIVLGRTRSGTLRLLDEERGLRFECDLPESRQDLRESIQRGDLDGASFRFEVGQDEWQGDVRTVQSVRALHDVSLASYPAYPSASIEMRTDPRPSSSAPAEPAGLVVRDRERRPSVRGPAAESRTLGGAFRDAGFPAPLGESASIPWGEFRALTVSGDDNETPTGVSRSGVRLGMDERNAFGAFSNISVDAGVMAVDVLSQTARSLATAANVVRAIDAVTTKPETGSTVDVATVGMNQVATVQSAIPNIYLEQDAFNTIIENDLRLAIEAGLDKLVQDALAATGCPEVPGTNKLLVSIRNAIETIEAAGYNADTLLLTPAAAKSLDVLEAGTAGEQFYVFSPGQFAPPVFGLTRRVSKTIAAPAVVDSTAFGKMYMSPVSLARFEANAGLSNTSNVRMELHAAFGTERALAAVRIAAT